MECIYNKNGIVRTIKRSGEDMRQMILTKADDKTLKRLLNTYRASSHLDTVDDIRIYKAYRFHGYSTLELSKIEHMARSTIYRRILRVDNYIKSCLEKEIP